MTDQPRMCPDHIGVVFLQGMEPACVCCAYESRITELEAKLAEAEKYREAFHRELRDLQHEVAKACQASGTMLTDLQPEAMTIVAEVCRAHPKLRDAMDSFTWYFGQHRYRVSQYEYGVLLHDTLAARYSQPINNEDGGPYWHSVLAAIEAARAEEGEDDD